MQIVIDIDKDTGVIKMAFSKDYTGSPIEDLERLKFALLANPPKETSKIVTPKKKLVGVK